MRPQADHSPLALAFAIVLDHLVNATTEAAELVLPSGTFAESDGTLVNSEGTSAAIFSGSRPKRGCTGELAVVA